MGVFAFWSAIAPLSGGCLVTQDIEFQQQDDVPPAFVFRPRNVPAIGETLTVDTDALSNQNMTELSFSLHVRDDNVNQPLQTQIRLRTREKSPTSFTELTIIDVDGSEIPAIDQAVRPFSFSFSTTQLLDLHCHQLELAVSGEFDDFDGELRIFGFPKNDDDDVAIATWWLWEITGDTAVNLDTCPTREFP